jgi:cyanophycinase
MSTPVFLHGGGLNLARALHDEACFRPFVEACHTPQRPLRVLMVIHESHQDDLKHYHAMLRRVGVQPEQIEVVVVSNERGMTPADVLGVTGVFVCGGKTPDIHYALCQDITWLRTLRRENLPYCGFGAGAAIATQYAIVGGSLYQNPHGGELVQVAPSTLSEGLSTVDVRPGLNLAPQLFQAVDVRASQAGALMRAYHLVQCGALHTVAAIDEMTLMELNAGQLIVHGAGRVYEVRDISGKVEVSVFWH